MSQQTIGQKRVKAEFNPDKNGRVDQIKNLSAQLIDLLDEGREGGSPERQRQISIAQTEIETAAMYGVKSCFTE